MNNTETVAGITYTKPEVTLLHATPLLTSEYAGRTAYDSFTNSEHESIRNQDTSMLEADSSVLLDQLAWTHFHHSVLEHISINYLIKGTSRGVLQELVRHRIASYTVRSTRYTMSSILNAFMSFHKAAFIDYIVSQDMFVVTGSAAKLEASQLYAKLELQEDLMGAQEFLETSIAKSSLHFVADKLGSSLFKALEAGKKKRNIGDAFKWCVTDNFKTDLVVTFNLRSLKNYIDLRASNSAYFQIQWLAEEMIRVTPRKYLDLIVKPDKLTKILNKT